MKFCGLLYWIQTCWRPPEVCFGVAPGHKCYTAQLRIWTPWPSWHHCCSCSCQIHTSEWHTFFLSQIYESRTAIPAVGPPLMWKLLDFGDNFLICRSPCDQIVPNFSQFCQFSSIFPFFLGRWAERKPSYHQSLGPSYSDIGEKTHLLCHQMWPGLRGPNHF